MKSLSTIFLATSILIVGAANAQTEVPNTFQSGQPARASEVNENFDTLETAVDQNAGSIAANESALATAVSDIATNAGSIDTNAADIANNSTAIQDNSASIQALDIGILEAEVQTATDFGRQGLSTGVSSLSIIEQLVRTLGLTCAEANYGRFLGCTQLTSGDGTVWPIVGLLKEIAVAVIRVEGVSGGPDMLTPNVYAAQTNGGNGEMLLGGPANFTRSFYRDADDVGRLVDDCDNPTVAMSPVSLNGTNSRWRVNNGAYYYAPVDATTGQFVPIGQIDVTGQMVGIVKNINPFSVFDVNSVVWCEMSDQVTGDYNMYDLRPYPFNLNEARFSQPFTID